MDEIDKSRRTEISRASIQFVAVAPDHLRGEFADVVELFGVVREEHGVRFFSANVNHVAHNFFFLPFPVCAERYFNICLRDVHRVGAGIENQGLSAADFVRHNRIGHAVIVSAKEHINVRHLFSHLECGMIEHTTGRIVFAHAAVHYHHHDVGFGSAANDRHHSACCFHTVAKVEIFPKVFGQPLWNGWGDHAEHADAHTVHLFLHIGCEIEFVLAFVHHVSAQYGEAAIVHPTIVD